MLRLFTLLAALALALGACSPGPDYVRPAVDTPAAFATAGRWKPAQGGEPSPAAAWWTVFQDAQLDQLEQRIAVDNQNLKIAEAQYRAARANLAAARSPLFPSLTASVARTRSGGSSPGTSAATNYTASAGVNWELDVWGRLRRNIEAGDARLAASAADLAAARLSLQALLAQTYVQLRGVDLQLALLERSVAAYARFLQLTRNRQDAGVAAPLDVAQAETQLASAEAQAIDLQNQRAQIEHALAVLVGQPPGSLGIAAASALPDIPPTPSLLPTTLLERRPDIVAAERRVAAANAQIGVATAAWFPVLDLNGSLAYRHSELAQLFDLPNRVWSLGPTLAMTLLDGGGRQAAMALAEAGYDQAVASYRQTALTAFQEVEDNLAAAHWLKLESEAQARALAAARRARAIADNQYRAGIVSALNVVTAQASELAAEVSSIGIASRRLQAAVQLIKNAAGQLPAELAVPRAAGGASGD